MNSKYLIVLLIVIALVIVLILLLTPNIPQEAANCTLKDKVTITNFMGQSVTVNVELATTPSERASGLMFRDYLPQYSGMFFVFENDQYLSFWMKNTLLPLDMIFINSTLDIVTIHEADPCKEDPCITYKSNRPAMYVLEVNQGFSQENGIGNHDKVSFC